MSLMNLVYFRLDWRPEQPSQRPQRQIVSQTLNFLSSSINFRFSSSSIKPTLKKVSKYENKFAKLQKKAAEFNFRNQLKVVKKKEFTLEEEDKEVSLFCNYFPILLFWFLIFNYFLSYVSTYLDILFFDIVS